MIDGRRGPAAAGQLSCTIQLEGQLCGDPARSLSLFLPVFTLSPLSMPPPSPPIYPAPSVACLRSRGSDEARNLDGRQEVKMAEVEERPECARLDAISKRTLMKVITHVGH